MREWHQQTVGWAIASAPSVAYGLDFWGFRPAVLMYLLLLLALLLDIGARMEDTDA